jgi:hypothetical protein
MFVGKNRKICISTSVGVAFTTICSHCQRVLDNTGNLKPEYFTTHFIFSTAGVR